MPASGEVRSEAPQRLAMDANGVPVAWTLQVATVSSAEKAEHLRKQLLEHETEGVRHDGAQLAAKTFTGFA